MAGAGADRGVGWSGTRRTRGWPVGWSWETAWTAVTRGRTGELHAHRLSGWASAAAAGCCWCTRIWRSATGGECDAALGAGRAWHGAGAVGSAGMGPGGASGPGVLWQDQPLAQEQILSSAGATVGELPPWLPDSGALRLGGGALTARSVSKPKGVSPLVRVTPQSTMAPW